MGKNTGAGAHDAGSGITDLKTCRQKISFTKTNSKDISAFSQRRIACVCGHRSKSRPAVNIPFVSSLDNQSAIHTRHRVYDRIFRILQNKKVKLLKSTLSVCPQHGVQVNGLEIEITIDAPAALFYQLRRSGETHLIERAGAVVVPGFVLNACICEDLQRRFPVDQLIACPGFIYRGREVFLDIDSKHVRRGFLVPVYRGELISGLKMFRRPGDEHPFMLRSREESAIWQQ